MKFGLKNFYFILIIGASLLFYALFLSWFGKKYNLSENHSKIKKQKNIFLQDFKSIPLLTKNVSNLNSSHDTSSHQNNHIPMDFWQNTIVQNGKKINIDNMKSPVFVTFINYGFQNLAANFFCNLQHVMPHVLHHHLIVIVDTKETAQWISNYNSKIAYFLYVNENQKVTADPSDYESGNYKQIMMHRGNALLQFLGKGVPILWLEPDAAYLDDLLSTIPNLINSNEKFIFFDDSNKNACGCFIKFPGDEKSKLFYERVLHLAKTAHDQNDQHALNSIKDQVNYEILDTCTYRSGIYAAEILPNGKSRLTDCDGKRLVVQHFNWVVGIHKKIEMAKKMNAWYVDDDTLQCKPRDIKAVIMTMNRKKSLERLVLSLGNSECKQIDLHFSVDVNDVGEPNPEIMDYIENVKNSWTKGFVTSKVWASRAGILKNWIEAWPAELYETNQYKATILFEDDLEVSPVFHQWFIGAHQAYDDTKLGDRHVGAITGQRPQLIPDLEYTHVLFQDQVPPGVHAFAYSLMATWSLSPKVGVWSRFRKWFQNLPPDFNVLIPNSNLIVNEWYQTFKKMKTEKNMWEMYYIYFSSVVEKQYTVYAWLENGSKTFVCNWKEKGLHFDGSQSQSPDFPLASDFDSNVLNQPNLYFVHWDAKFKSQLQSSQSKKNIIKVP